MKKLFTLASVLLISIGSSAQEYNLFPTSDGWLRFNTQETIDKYVGLIDEDAYKVITGDAAKLVQMVYADQKPNYPATEADPDIVGAGNNGETGSEGSTNGALVLQPSSAQMTVNGGGFVVYLPSCSTFSIDYSSNSRVMARIVATTNPTAPMQNISSNYDLNSDKGWKVISAKYVNVFNRLPLGHKQWTGIESLNNGSDNVTIKSKTPIYVWFQSATKDTIYIHGIKVTTPKQETTGVRNITASYQNGASQVYTLDGKLVGTRESLDALEHGVYIVKSAGKAKKVVK